MEKQNKKNKKQKTHDQRLFNKHQVDEESFESEKSSEYFIVNSLGERINVNAENHRFYLNRTHLMVGALKRPELDPIYIEVGFWQLRDSILPRVEAFLKGAHLYDWEIQEYQPEFWTNTSNCFHSFTNLTWVTLPGWLKYIVADNPSLW